MDKGKVIKSLIYKFSEQMAIKILSLAIQILLARLLGPGVFGQIAIIMIFINFSQNFIVSGFNAALVQKKDVADVDYSTALFITTGLAVFFNIVIFFSAPLIGNFYNAVELVLPLRVFAIILFFGAFNSIQRARLQREMKFKEMMVCNLASTFISGLCGVSTAYIGMGIWSLIIYHMINILVCSVIMIFYVRLRPKLVFSKERAKVLFNFGWKMLVSSCLCSLFHDTRSLIIGKKFSTEDLAYYNRGQQFPHVISETADTAVQSVMFPVLAEVQDNAEKLKSAIRRSLGVGTFIIFPAMVGLAAISENFIRVLLTEEWLPAVPYMQVLCFLEIGNPYISTNLTAIKAIGRSDVYMKLEIIRRAMMMVILLISVFCFDSVMAIAVAATFSYWIDAFIGMVSAQKYIGYSVGSQLKETWKSFLCALIMGSVVYFIGFFEIPTAVLLCVQILCGAVTYVVLCVIMRVESFYYCMDILQKLCSKV